MILAALAAGAGLARGISGYVSAHKQGARDRDLIKRAYQISKGRLNQQEGDIRQNTTESLNARGVLSGGDNVASSPAVAAAQAGGFEDKRMAADATRGQTGQGNTLAGGVESQLSNENLLEQKDLWQQREQGIKATKREQQAGELGAISAGIQTASSVYSAGQQLGAGGGASASTAAPASAGTGGPIAPGLWFGGYDPTDPLGMNKRGISNGQFNVLGSK